MKKILTIITISLLTIPLVSYSAYTVFNSYKVDTTSNAYHLYWYRDQSPGLGLKGNIDGVNTDFSIPYNSIECATVDINGRLQRYPVDYQDISYGGGIIFRFAIPPQATDKIFITYCTTVQPF